MTLKNDGNKVQFLRNMYFLCNAMDLKQTVEGKTFAKCFK